MDLSLLSHFLNPSITPYRFVSRGPKLNVLPNEIRVVVPFGKATVEIC